VQALAPEERQVTTRLAALVRRQLVRPDRAQLGGDDGYRFRHLLIRDAAYAALPKTVRGELHRRFADFLEQRHPELVELDELVGYHLEQAHRYLAELGRDEPELAAQAADHLRRALVEASRRRDSYAIVNLARRTLALRPPGAHLDLRLELAIALYQTSGVEQAMEVTQEAVRAARAAGNAAAEAAAQLEEAILLARSHRQGVSALSKLIEQLAPTIERSDNLRAQLQLFHARVEVDLFAMRYDSIAGTRALSVDVARALGRPDLVAEETTVRLYALAVGSTPASAVRREISRVGEAGTVQADGEVWLLAKLAMLDDLKQARTLLAQHTTDELERGHFRRAASSQALHGVEIELLAGDATAAERLGRAGCKKLAELGEQGHRATGLCRLADALILLGHLQEAEARIAEARGISSPDDLSVEIGWRRAAARIQSRRGVHEEAEQLAREALTIVLATEDSLEQAETYACLSEVLARAGREKEACESQRQALDLCVQKEAPVYAEYVNRRLAAVIDPPAPLRAS
jgi:tetratricopeptide (TPR) repeat protein